jgi:hypothetical protein
MRVASRMRPEWRLGRSRLLSWEYDGVLVDSFTLSVDGTEYDLGALTPVSGTTYQAVVPSAVVAGAYEFLVYAVNAQGRSGSLRITETVA